MSFVVAVLIAIGLPLAVALAVSLDSTQLLMVILVSEVLALIAFTLLRRAERRRVSH